jgi:hypothetical protein
MAAKKRKKRPTAPPPPVRTKPPREAAAPTGPTRREEARRAQRAQARRDALRRRLGTLGLVAVVLAVVSLIVFLDRRGDTQLRAALTGGSCSVDDESDPTAGPGANHVSSPTFQVNPPAGGNHLASVARGGVFAGPSVPADGLLVHALEHGYIVVWHEPDLSAEQRSQLEDFEAAHDGDVIVAERAGMPTSVAATAWNQRLLCDDVETGVLSRFLDEYLGKGPEKVRRG